MVARDGQKVHRSEPRLPNADFLVQLARRPLVSLDGRRRYVSLDGLLLRVGPLYRPLQRLGATRALGEVARLHREVFELQYENARLQRRLAAVARPPRPRRTRGRHSTHKRRKP